MDRSGQPQNPQGAVPVHVAGTMLRWMCPWVAGLALAASPIAPRAVPAGEQGSRDEVVAALEHESGPSKGPADAPVIMVAFSDFQCSYCRKFWHETYPRIQAQYIRPGKVRFVYRHLAVLGSRSLLAAEAASCAEDQGRFWQYHEALFGNMAPYVMNASRLKQVAATLGLDRRPFDACLDSGKYAERIEAETLAAHALGATGTPAFLINGRLLIGAYPFESFREYLDTVLGGVQRTPAK